VRPAAADRAAAQALVAGVSRPRIALAPGAAYGETKRWPAERFGALAARLAAARGASIFVTGAAGDRSVADAVVRSGAGRARNVTGKTDLGTAAALFAEMDLVVTNDSGAMHLAAAVGAPIVAIFGSTSPAWTAPLGNRTRIIVRDEPCAPCFARTCGIGTVCLTRIEVDEVYRACDDLLGEAEARGRS
jgi:heptosyltransferase-2